MAKKTKHRDIRNLTEWEHLLIETALFAHKASWEAQGKTPVGGWGQYDALLAKVTNAPESAPEIEFELPKDFTDCFGSHPERQTFKGDWRFEILYADAEAQVFDKHWGTWAECKEKAMDYARRTGAWKVRAN